MTRLTRQDLNTLPGFAEGVKGIHREGQTRLFSARLLLPSEGSPGRLGFQIGIKNPYLGQKVEAGLGPWREQTREDFLEEAVHNIPERMG